MRMIKFWMLTGAFLGLMVEPTVEPMTAENFVRYAMTQGGLFSLVIVLAYFYRRDLVAMAAEKARDLAAASEAKSERIQVLTTIVEKATEAQTKNAETMHQSIIAIAAQAASIQAVATTLTRLEVSLLPTRRSSDA